MRWSKSFISAALISFIGFSAFAEPPNVGLHGDQAGNVKDWQELIIDDGFTRAFWTRFKSFDDDVHNAAKQNNGVLFFILVDHNENTTERIVKIFKPLATGPDFRRTLIVSLASSPDVLLPGADGHKSVYGYAFAHRGKDGMIYRAIATDTFYKVAMSEAMKVREIQAIRQERVKEQGRVIDDERAKWQAHLERVKQQEDIESLRRMLEGSYKAGVGEPTPPVDTRHWMYLGPPNSAPGSPFVLRDVIELPQRP
ncbi:hypothetical protein [Bradyrhizobium sp. RD5-C2]|uniref:hypothetical protein n=1 Tax=Bradyrhizobium sp. RD5-C2 TaxID=244562 RepID=UPI001CC5F4E2|nr:hypothetical protein [Bradyrhizobium sp. RD5-C2]GIQ79052.1 hypothetical protein BraRD5C2_75040 [Bradyrhizobium sp. RD5-C2]